MKDYLVLLSDEGQIVGIIVIPNESQQSFRQNVEENEARIKNLVADAIEGTYGVQFDDLQNEITLEVTDNYQIVVDAGQHGEFSLTPSSVHEL